MAYVPGCKFDIFISYPREANAEAWVEKYAATLKDKLNLVLPGAAIFFDKSDYKAQHHRRRMLDAAAASALFMPILAPAYVAKDKFTLLELNGFCRSCEDEDRIVIIEIYPVGEDRPASLHGPNRNRFYQEEPPHMTLKPGTRAYESGVMKIAESVADRLKEVAAQYRKTVLLGSVTDDVREYWMAVADDLRASGFTVLPEEEYSGSRNSGEERFKADLTKADLFVQLLGQGPASAGTADASAPSVAELQFNEAKKVVGIHVLQWARPDIDPARLPAGSYRRLLEGSDVKLMSLKEFKNTIKDTLKNVDKKIAKPPPLAGREIYIAAHRTDEEYTQRLKTFLIELGYKSYDVLNNVDNLADLKSIIETAYGFFVIEGNVEKEFVTNLLRNYKKLRYISKKHPQIEALIYAPPPREDKKYLADVSFDGLDYFLPPEAFPQKNLEERLRGGGG
jgi:hypothetical protein